MFRVSKYSPEHMGRGWTQGCKDLREDSEKVDAWMNTIRRREQSAGGEWDPKIMSHFRLVDNCTGCVLRRVPIEPLASFLRHPRHHCFTPKPEEKSAAFSDNRFSPNYLVPLWRGEVEPAPEPPRRCFFFDIGARVYAPEHLAWFVDAYRARGVKFDRIFSRSSPGRRRSRRLRRSSTRTRSRCSTSSRTSTCPSTPITARATIRGAH